MSNVNTPHGFSFAYTLHGGPPAIEYFRCGSCTEVFQGDFVFQSSSSLKPKSTGSDWDAGILSDSLQIVGVAAAYSRTDSSDMVPVYTDLRNTVFKVQVRTTDLATATSNIGATFDTTWVAGSTRTGISGHQINGTTATKQGCGARLLRYDTAPNYSTSGGYQEVYVTLNSPGGGDLYEMGATTA